MNKKDYEILNFLETQKKCRVPEVVLISSGPLRNNRLKKLNLESMIVHNLLGQLVGSHDFVF